MSLSPAPALDRCVGDADAFRTELWGRRSQVRLPASAGREAFADLLGLRDVDALITGVSLRAPLFRLVKGGSPLPQGTYTTSATIGGIRMDGVADPAAVLGALDDGATLVLQGLQRFWPPLAGFVRQLELDLGHPCQVNAYLTPPGSQGLAVHSDEHDVFVLQVYGSKQWEISAAPGEGDVPPRDVVLTPGATLYLPQGTPHAARAQETLSLHLTFGVLATTWRSVLDLALRRIDGGLLDERLPVSFTADREAFAGVVAGRLGEIVRALDKVDAAELADAVVDRFATARPRPLAGGLLDRVALASLEDGTLLRRRPGAIAVLRPAADAERVRLLLGDRELRLPAGLTPALAEVADRFSLRPADLAAYLGPRSRLVLVRRLVLEGLLEVVLEH